MQAQCLSFSNIPESSKLFLDFLYAFPRVSRYYGHPPYATAELLSAEPPRQSPEHRSQIADVLRDQNRRWGASERTLSNIELLRGGAGAIVTGQQVALFGGPAYTLYKALTAIKLAQRATEAGNPCVPIFWMATEDHDLAEVNHVFFPAPDGRLHRLATESHGEEDQPVGSIKLGEDIGPHVQWIKDNFGTSEVCSWLEECYRPGATFAEAFARFLCRVFNDHGLIIVDPMDGRFHKIAAPLYSQVISQSQILNEQLLERNKELEEAGYHAQVKVTESTSLLFALDERQRIPIHRKNGSFEIRDQIISPEQLQRQLAEATERFSANALLRPVVQDYLFPTLAYVGGSAEVAYFAQSEILYHHLLGRTTPILPRFSATLIEPRIAQWLEKYRLQAREVMCSEAELQVELARRVLPGDLQKRLQESKGGLDAMLSPLTESLRKLDPTLAEAAEVASRKMHYQLERIGEKAASAEVRRNGEITRHAT
ncbi:MAG TPA: bacillithiol biosynthesis cysteine-adding enzyme BshC, partial [Terriglobales bacterium]